MSMLEKLGIVGNGSLHPITYKGRTIGYARIASIGDEICNLGANKGKSVYNGYNVSVDVTLAWAVTGQVNVALLGWLQQNTTLHGWQHIWQNGSNDHFVRYPLTGYIALSGSSTDPGQTTTYTMSGNIVNSESGLYRNSYYDLHIALVDDGGNSLSDNICMGAVYWKGALSAPKVTGISNLQIS